MTRRLKPVHLALALAVACPPLAQAVDRATLQQAIATYDREAIEAIGPEAMPVLVSMYREADVAKRRRIANVFYQLGWQSEEAKEALMQDIHTEDENLRISVQYALGRVSNGDEVVDALLDNMRHGFNPLVRDKAACGLAYDQIHLTERQKLSLYRRLVERLEDPSAEQRSLAIRVLQVHTGQTKGFHPLIAKPEALARWQEWLEDYAASLEE